MNRRTVKTLAMALLGTSAVALATPASALVWTFTFSGGGYAGSFSIDAATVPGFSSGQSSTFFNVPVSYNGTSALSTAQFFNNNALGGLYLYTQSIVTLVNGSGPQLFTGPQNDPTFTLGTFNLPAVGSAFAYTLTISSDAGAAPEPAAWALLIAGFGGIGASLRRRQRVTVRYAG